MYGDSMGMSNNLFIILPMPKFFKIKYRYVVTGDFLFSILFAI